MEKGREQENIFLGNTVCRSIPKLKERSLISVIKTSLAVFKFMKEQNAEMMISVSRNDFGVCKAVCRATGAAFLPVIPGGKIGAGAKNLSSVLNEKFICFSKENENDLLINGVPEENIHVISNRISAAQDLEWRSHYSKKESDQPLNILLVSRLDPSHEQGIISFMERIAAYDGNVVLHIAGDGSFADKFREYAEKLNEKKEVIHFLGYISDMEALTLKSDIIVGKGRSVITPIMTNRFGFVLGYDGGLTICNEETVDELYKFNFSGRSSTHLLTNEQFFDLCEKIRNDAEYREELSRVFEAVRDKYSIDGLPDKLLPLINEMQLEIKGVKFGALQKCKTVLLSIGVYIKWLWSHFKTE